MDQLLLDTRGMPAADRFPNWKQGIADYAVSEVAPAEPFDGRSTVTGLGALLISESVLPPLRFTRTPAMLRDDGHIHWTLTLMLEGSFQGHADGEPMQVTIGRPCLLDLSRPSDLVTTRGRSIVVVLPRNLLQERAPSTDAHGPLSDSAATRLLANYLIDLCAALPDLDERAALPTARALCDLVAASLPGDSPSATSRRRSHALKGSVLALVEARPSERFTVHRLAAELGVSRSALYRAVDGPEGVAGLIRNCRLEAAHRALTDFTDRRSVSEISRDCGFRNGSRFSQQFRSAFGYTPTALRRAAIAPSQLRESSDSPAIAFRDAVERLANGPAAR
jgi:AraC-like DNA-binding protein